MKIVIEKMGFRKCIEVSENQVEVLEMNCSGMTWTTRLNGFRLYLEKTQSEMNCFEEASDYKVSFVRDDSIIKFLFNVKTNKKESKLYGKIVLDFITELVDKESLLYKCYRLGDCTKARKSYLRYLKQLGKNKGEKIIGCRYRNNYSGKLITVIDVESYEKYVRGFFTREVVYLIEGEKEVERCDIKFFKGINTKI